MLQDWKILLVWRGSCLAFKWRKWRPQMLSSLILSVQILYWIQREVGWLNTDHWTGRIIHQVIQPVTAWISLSRIIRWGPWNLHVQLKDACWGALQVYSQLVPIYNLTGRGESRIHRASTWVTNTGKLSIPTQSSTVPQGYIYFELRLQGLLVAGRCDW